MRSSLTANSPALGTSRGYVEETPFRRYTLTAQALHWVTAALMLAILPLAWVMTSMADADPSRGTIYTIHKSVGLTIFTLVVIRLLWRSANHAPPLAGREPRWLAMSAKANHWLLYLVMFGMPISGYLLSAAGGHPISYFGLFTVPGIPKNETLAKLAESSHIAGQWAVYLLVVLHLAGTAYHVAVRRDGVLGRMLPPQTNEP